MTRATINGGYYRKLPLRPATVKVKIGKFSCRHLNSRFHGADGGVVLLNGLVQQAT